MSLAVELRDVSKRYGPVTAVDRVSLTIETGEFLTLLGPSGCGKTTLLRLIAGFEKPDQGSVALDGRDVTQMPPHERNVNQVFQSYALFPHLSVSENIAFGLRRQGVAAPEITRRVADAIELVALGGCENRRPHQLSGGQRQRVALARALAPRPAVLLLDEPLSALDARLRESMQLELKRLQRQVRTTFVFVTHDQEEALAMSDRIALIHQGRIEQLGEVQEIYHRPATAFAAEFIGRANLLEAELIASHHDVALIRLAGGIDLRIPAARWPHGRPRASVAIRPEKLHLNRTPSAEENSFEVRILEKVFKGPTEQTVLRSTSSVRLIALATHGSALSTPHRVGDVLWCTVHADDVVVLPEAPEISTAR